MKYKDSGVDIDRAKRTKDSIGRHVKSTWGKSVLSETGAFGGLFELGKQYKSPVLVSSIDGVGTKLVVAGLTGRYDTIGQDLVNHCVNDILVQGARPLFFLDYIASGTLDVDVVEGIVSGIAVACRENGCALIGGETAEMPGIYQGNDVDVAGCIVGVVEKEKVIDGTRIKPGDLVLGLPATGLHTNGYSLARHIVFDKLGLKVGDYVDELGCSVGDELLKIHPSYVNSVQRISEIGDVRGLAHITGGGIVDNLPRILPSGCDARLTMGSWPVLPVFDFLQKSGAVEEAEMYQVFNMGIGMIVVVDPAVSDKLGEGTVHRIGNIVDGSGKVTIA